MWSFLSAASGWLVVSLSCALVRAQPNPELTPPVAASSMDVPYPAGGEGDTFVRLELIVEKDGVVSRATVLEGEPPFAEQARDAALGWRFIPAARAGQPVAARIRVRVDFHRDAESPTPNTEASAQPSGSTSGPSAANAASNSSSASAADASVLAASAVEVTVAGERHEIGQTTLDKSDVRQMPGAFGDAFRAIEALPGVTPIASGLPYFYLRGAPPNNAGYFIDGIRVPLLFHLGLAQSVIHPGLIEQVAFFPSAAPASYGRYAGGIVAGRTRAPATAFHGEANLRLVDAGALLEAPFAEGRGSALIAGRYGYPGPVIALITDEMRLGYWDYQARASYRPSRRGTLSLFGFGSHDYLATRSPSQDPEASKALIEQFVSDSHRLDLRYDHELEQGRLRFAMIAGYDSQGAQPTYVKNRSLGARLELEQALGAALRFRGGADALLEDYSIRVTRQGPGEPMVPQSATPPPTNLSAGVHADFVWRVAPRVELIPGARFDLFASTRRRESPSTGVQRTTLPAVDPRLSARVVLAPGLAWLSAFAIAHQYPSLRVGDVPAPLVSVPGFPFGVRRLQTAAQASQGLELALPANFVMTATGFLSRWWGLTDLSASCFQLEPAEAPPPGTGEVVPPYVCPNNRPVRGHGYGVELLLRRPFTERLSGWLSYTLSRTVQGAHFLTPSGTEDTVTVPSAFDRTHVLNAVLGYDMGRGWRFGSRFVFYTGTPYSHLQGSLAVPPYNAYRAPSFYRVDVRLEKRWRLGANGSVAFVVEGQNVTLQKEVTNLGLECEGNGSPGQRAMTTCEPSKIGPLTIPSIGIEAFF